MNMLMNILMNMLVEMYQADFFIHTLASCLFQGFKRVLCNQSSFLLMKLLFYLFLVLTGLEIHLGIFNKLS